MTNIFLIVIHILKLLIIYNFAYNNCKLLYRGPGFKSGMRKVRTTQSIAPPNGWGSLFGENTESVAEKNRSGLVLE